MKQDSDLTFPGGSPPWSGIGEKASEPELIPLHLVFEYPVRWSKFQIFRDFIQNFFDAIGSAGFHDRFTYGLSNAGLTMVAADVGFCHEWLIPIGASTKRTPPDASRADSSESVFAGHFGEGFKIAALCALRDFGWQVEMASRDWELRVVCRPTTIESRPISALAYEFWRDSANPRPWTSLVIKNVCAADLECFLCRSTGCLSP